MNPRHSRSTGHNDKSLTIEEKSNLHEADREPKMQTHDSKTKVEKDGDSKSKTEDGKVKTDEEGVKVK